MGDEKPTLRQVGDWIAMAGDGEPCLMPISVILRISPFDERRSVITCRDSRGGEIGRIISVPFEEVVEAFGKAPADGGATLPRACPPWPTFFPTYGPPSPEIKLREDLQRAEKRIMEQEADNARLRARVAELEAQLAAYQADAPRTFAYSSCAPIEMSPPGSETHRGHPVLTEEECAAMPCPLPPKEPESDELAEWKACVRAWSEWAGREVRGLRQRAEKAEARVTELLTSSFFGATVLKAEKYEQEAAALRARVAELEGEREKTREESTIDDDSRHLVNLIGLREHERDQAIRDRDAARAHANDLVAKLMRADARLRAVVEPARALCEEIAMTIGELYGYGDQGWRRVKASRWNEIERRALGLRAALATLEKEAPDAE